MQTRWATCPWARPASAIVDCRGGSSRRQRRYDVDVSDHFRTLTADLPAEGDAHHFNAKIDVIFRVTDPVEVVRRNIVDGVPFVLQQVLTMIRPVARTFPIDQAAEAETAIHDLFRTPVRLPEGITLVRCMPQLTIEDSARAFLRNMWELRHGSDERLRQFELNSQRQVEVNMSSLLAQHLALNPQDTVGAIELVRAAALIETERQAGRDDAAMKLLKVLLEESLLQPSDVESLRIQALASIQNATTGPP